MYSLMVKPAILYGLETVAVTKKQIEEMDVAKMKMLRFAMGVTRKDWIQNEYIRCTVKVERLGIKMREGRMKCYGHVIRRDQECVRRRVMKIELPGNRKKGRPKKRLIKVLKENMNLVRGRSTLKTGPCVETSYAVAISHSKERPKEEEELFNILLSKNNSIIGLLPNSD